MNEPEYKAFWRSASLAYPRIAEFFSVVDFKSNEPLTDADWQDRHHLWKQTFFPLDNEDCQRALADMVAGTIAGPGFDCSDFPAKIRAQASEYRNRRAKELANAGLHQSLRGDGVKIRKEIHAGVSEIIRHAKALFIDRRPDIAWPWVYLDVCNFDRKTRWQLWQECVREACEQSSELLEAG